MDNKKTISSDSRCHLYSDNLDENNIYIELSDLTECSFELWEIEEGTKKTMVCVKIPVKSWKHIVKGWVKSELENNKLLKNK